MKPTTKSGYIGYVALVIASWGIVPGLAKLGGLSGTMTTMWVNWIAVFAILAIMLQQGKLQLLLQPHNWLKLIGWGLIWPLGYSLAYFTSVQLGCPSLTTITNYTWPAWFLLIGAVLGRKFSRRSVLFVLAQVGVIAFLTWQEGSFVLLLPLVLGLAAALAQGIYAFVSEDASEDPWVVTLVVEIVTAVGATIWIALRQEPIVMPTLPVWGGLFLLGAISNGIGFWAFLQANRLSSQSGEKVWCLLLLSLVPFAQVVFAFLMGAETPSLLKVSMVLVSTALLILYRYGEHKLTPPPARGVYQG